MAISKPQNATVIESLSDGFRAINRRPWLVLVPLAVNLFLWFGVQLSFEPLVDSFYRLLQQLPQEPTAGDLQAQYEQILALGRLDMRQPLALLNFVPLLMPYTLDPRASDSLSGSFPAVQALPQLVEAARPTIMVSGPGGALLALLVVNAVALAISAVFLTLVGEAVRRDRAALPVMLRRSWRAGLALFGYVAVVAGVLLLLGLPFGFFALLLLRLNPAIGLFALAIGWFVVFWVRIYIGFAPEAIAISGSGPFQAMRASFNIVRRNFWGTLGLLALAEILIPWGSGVIWYNLSGTLPGLLAAIAGSAYIGSGLLAGRMAFYRERLRRWQASTAAPAARSSV